MPAISYRSIYLLALILVAIVYWPVTGFEYVWDDAILIGKLGIHNQDTWLHRVFFDRFFVSDNYYRPIPLSTIVWQMRVFGTDAFAAHATNVLIHLVNVGLVGVLAYRLVQPGRELRLTHHVLVALLGVFYGLHPVLTEPVAWVSGRFDLLLVSFILLALLLDSVCSTKVRPLAVGICFFFAAFSKESAVVFPLILVFWHQILARIDGEDKAGAFSSWQVFRANLPVYIAVLAFGVIYLGVRFSALGFLLPGSYGESGAGVGIAQYTAEIFASIWLYVRQIFVPFVDMGIFYVPSQPLAFTDSQVLLGILVCAALLVIWLLTAVTRLWKCAFGAVAVAFIPIINILPLPIDDLIQNRFLALPLALLVVVVGALIVRAMTQLPESKSKLALIVFSFYGALFAFTSLTVLPVWKSSDSLWIWAAKPEYTLSMVKKGNALMNLGYPVEALKILESVPKEDEYYSTALSMRANTLGKMGRVNSVEPLIIELKSLGKYRSRSELYVPMVLLGSIYESKGDRDNAELWYQQALAVESRYVGAWEPLCYLYMGWPEAQDKAKNACDMARSLAISREHLESINNKIRHQQQ